MHRLYMGWEEVEQWYLNTIEKREFFRPTLNLMQEIRALGYDENLTVSLMGGVEYLSISRPLTAVPDANRHDRTNRPFIHIESNESGESINVSAHLYNRWYRLTLSPIALTTELISLLDMLLAQPIE